MLDFTTIATLFAFVLVCGGVLLIPRKESVPGKFNMPYINGKYLFPLIIALAIALIEYNNIGYFTGLFNINADNASLNISSIVFWLAMIIISVTAFVNNFSLIPLLGLSSCMYLLTGMTGENWAWFASWLVLGLIFYFLYGYQKSKLNERVRIA